MRSEHKDKFQMDQSLNVINEAIKVLEEKRNYLYNLRVGEGLSTYDSKSRICERRDWQIVVHKNKKLHRKPN